MYIIMMMMSAVGSSEDLQAHHRLLLSSSTNDFQLNDYSLGTPRSHLRLSVFIDV